MKYHSHSKKTILVIEDDLVQRDLLKEFLPQRGFKVITAKDGLEGLERLKKNNYDLVITDICMPFINGIGLAKCLKKEHPHIPVICITAYGGYPTRLAMDELCDVVIQKPYDLNVLLETIWKLLK